MFAIFTLTAARSTEKYLHIIDMNNPANPSILMTHVFDNAVDGMITALDACSDTISVALSAADPVNEGHVELFTPYNRADRVFTRIGRITGKSHPMCILDKQEQLYSLSCTAVEIMPIQRTIICLVPERF